MKTIEVNNLTKVYRLYRSPKDRLREIISLNGRKFHHEFHALSDVSFNVDKGQTLGIIGQNGSGKTTLLKIICGVMQPTFGSVNVDGRISSLLELGAGFNPEFTGRENVYMNAALMGMSREETDKQYKKIVSFADIGDFLDQPMKTYSSGMYVRLAFAVAINVEPDILVIDEALSVGDEAFQRKCFSRIQALQKSGVTVLFVSHNAFWVVELCDRAILLDRGELLLSGTPKFVVSKYHQIIYAEPDKIESLRQEIKMLKHQSNIDLPESGDAETVESRQSERDKGTLRAFYDPNMVPKSTISYAPRGAEIISPCLTTPEGERVNVLVWGRAYTYAYSVHFTETAFKVRFGMLIKTVSGFELGGGSSNALGSGIECIKAGSTVSVRFRFRCNLNPGAYFLNAGVLGMVDDQEVFLHRLIDAAMFRVQPEDELLSTGIVDFEIEPSVAVKHPSGFYDDTSTTNP